MKHRHIVSAAKAKKFFKDNENTKAYTFVRYFTLTIDVNCKVKTFCFSFKFLSFLLYINHANNRYWISIKTVKVLQNQQIYFKGNYLSYHSV